MRRRDAAGAHVVFGMDLEEAERLAHFERWGTSDELLRRQVSVAFRKFLSLVFYDREEVWPEIGYAL